MVFQVAAKLLDACVLGVAASGDTYGYDLTQKIGNNLQVSESALYPVLRRLSKEGMLTTYDAPFEGRNRKYYRITDLGRNQLEMFRQEWVNHKNVIEWIIFGGGER